MTLHQPIASAQARLGAAERLAHAIAACEREDALQVMSAALDDLSAGGPIASFDSIRSDAEFWADIAAPAELEAYFAASLKTLRRRPIGIKMRKRLFLALWASFTAKERQDFIAHANKGADMG